jgi:uncharacterized Zn finger protein
VTGGEAGHIATASGCNCFDAGLGRTCKHIIAVRLALLGPERLASALAMRLDQVEADVFAVADSGQVFRVTGGSCECAEFRAGGHRCPHTLAVALRALDAESRAILRERAATRPGGAAAPGLEPADDGWWASLTPPDGEGAP